MPIRNQPPWLPPLGHLAAVSIVSALAAWAGIELTREAGSVAAVWFTNGILLAILLTRPTRQWPALLAAGLAGDVVVGHVVGDSLAQTAVLETSNGVEILLAASLLHYRRGRAPDLTLPGGLIEFTLIGVVLAPALSGLMAARLLSPMWEVPFLPLLTRWYLGDALGIAVMTPLALSLLRREPMPLLAPAALARTLAVVGAHLLVATAVFAQSRLPLLFLSFPPLLLVVAVLGFPGAGLVILPTAAMAFAVTVAGHGPLMLIPDISPETRLAFLQLYLAVLCATAYSVGVKVTERRRLNQTLLDQHVRLARSERLYRLLANNASDIISRVRLDGQRLYVSPSVTEVLGWSVEEMVGADLRKHVHPDDFAVFMAVCDRMQAGMKQASAVYRYRRKDGSWAWLETRAHLVRGPDGTPVEFISNMRDVSRQKEAELALEAAMAELAQQAATDGLTGIPNRRRFDEMLAKEWRRAMRVADPLSLLLIDVDHFKAFNDLYGHQAGDECLRFVARTIAAIIRRPHDLVARYGGEEFVVVLPATMLDGAERMAQGIRMTIAGLAMPHAAGSGGAVTVSIGAASAIPRNDTLPAMLIEAADGALYMAKRNGRNHVAVADTPDAVRPPGDRVVPLLASSLHAAG
jgi:diguanylate cyclase (GGDEF)-like protein/PAS domain S-box-containing protein